jgi:hypothetical protein
MQQGRSAPRQGERLIIAHFPFTRVAFAALLLPVCGCLPAQEPAPGEPALIRVTNEVVVEKPERLGVNIGGSYYWSDMQHVANPLAHGGFSQGRQVLLIQAAPGATENTVRDAYFDPSDPDTRYTESFAGGGYVIATGARAGESGEITAHALDSNTFTLSNNGAPIAEGDVVWLRGPWTSRSVPDSKQEGIEQNIGIGDFRPLTDDGATLSLVPSGNGERDQALRVTFPRAGSGGIRHYIRSITGNTYTLHVRARAGAPGMTLVASMRNFGIPYPDEGNAIDMESGADPTLTDEWREFIFTASTPDDDRIMEETAAFELVVKADGAGFADIDAVWLEDRRSQTAHGFNRQMTEAIREAGCGVLRFYGVSSLASPVEDFTAGSTIDAPWTFASLSTGGRFNATDAVLDDWMLLSLDAQALPWITVGGANTPQDWMQLISYICAPSGFDAASQRRAPWVDRFDRIYLEIGNEWWNPVFRPYHVMPPQKYGEICALIIEAVKTHPYYDPDRIKIIAGGWAANGHHWNGEVERLAKPDYLSLAPYLLQELNDYSTPVKRLNALFGDVEGYAATGGRSTLDDLKDSSVRLAVYELNTHLTGGRAPASVASEICTSAAAGVAVLDQAMAVMHDMKASPINYFTILQRSYDDRLGLWGALVKGADGSLRARPVWHGLRLANKHLIAGDMVATEVSTSATWDQPENGSVPEMDDVPYIHAYAFRDGDQLNVLVINRHPRERHAFTFSLPEAVQPNVQAIQLAADDPFADNEAREEVKLREIEVDAYTPGHKYTVPAASATVFKFVVSAT